jgi:4-hydroxy-tetrahydrodipicolinate synthase
MKPSVAPQFTGVIPPVVTALSAEGTLDRAGQEAVIADQLDAGVDGIFVAGTTGEGPYLTPEFLKELTACVVGCVAGQVPVLVGALTPGTCEALALGRAAEALGADGIVATVPFYVAASPEEQINHFRLLGQGLGVPVLAYSIPPMTHQVMEPGVIEEIFGEGWVCGLKDSGHDFAALRQAIGLGRHYGKAVFSGFEPFADVAVQLGASGIVASSCNVDPRGFVNLWRLASGGSTKLATEAHSRLIRLLGAFGALPQYGVGPTSGLISGIKAALQLRGILNSRAVLPPLTEYPASAMTAVTNALEEADLL